MIPTVLILSSLYDFATDLVVEQLAKQGVQYLRLNREQLSEFHLTLDPVGSTLSVLYGGNEWCIGPELGAVWFRQPVFLRNTPGEALSPEEQLKRSQWTAFLRSLMVMDHARWMNSPAHTYLAEVKPYQLALASRCGFDVPETIVTNDAQRIARAFNERLIIKSLDTVLLRQGDDCLFTYSTIGSSSILSDAQIKDAPLIAQALVDRKADIRVTIIGEQLFAVKILVNGHGIEGDWRITPKEALEFQDITLSNDVQRKCHDVARNMKLSFAAIDLMETADGIYFVEVNPTGEWAWLTSNSRPMDLAIANWLIGQ